MHELCPLTAVMSLLIQVAIVKDAEAQHVFKEAQVIYEVKHQLASVLSNVHELFMCKWWHTQTHVVCAFQVPHAVGSSHSDGNEGCVCCQPPETLVFVENMTMSESILVSMFAKRKLACESKSSNTHAHNVQTFPN